jgi:hypothetical protein
VLESFKASFGEDGTIFGLPDTASHLEMVRSPEPAVPVDRIDSLVFYLHDTAARERLVAHERQRHRSAAWAARDWHLGALPLSSTGTAEELGEAAQAPE